MGFPGPTSAAERSALVTAESEGTAFVAYRDGYGDLRILRLSGGNPRTIGRTENNDLPLLGNLEVSRTHAQLQAHGAGWSIVDDQLSRNGTYVNGDLVRRFRRLEDHDVIRIGTTSIVFRQPRVVGDQTTSMASGSHRPHVTPAEQRVLIELCRPLLQSDGLATPATNPTIADELVISVAGVKSHVRSLFTKLEIGEMAQNRKRAELAHRALQLGLVTERDT